MKATVHCPVCPASPGEKHKLSCPVTSRPDAMTGLATGKKREREQDILTPQVVIDFLRNLWGDIILDPCASRDIRSVVRAANKVYEPHGSPGGDLGGLGIEWVDRTYVNPPFKHLRVWLQKAAGEAAGRELGRKVSRPRVALLGPTRGHRGWWHSARDTCQVVVELKPLTFIGYNGMFPAPLSLLLWNDVTVEQARTAAETVGLGCTKIAAP